MNSTIRMLAFSKDRALQLEACLRSLTERRTDRVELEILVVFRCSDERHLRQYQKLIRAFPDVRFIQENDFRKDVLQVMKGSDVIGFVVDDNIFIRNWSMETILDHFETTPDAIGFSLRLGRNINFCYPFQCEQSQPDFQEIGEGCVQYEWPGQEYDFGYPLEVSSSFYRTGDLLPLVEEMTFDSPNSFEHNLAVNSSKFVQSHPRLLCFEHSVAFCCPVNLVQETKTNKFGLNHPMDVGELADLFDSGMRVRLTPLDSFSPVSCHQEVELEFEAIRIAE
jgi:hypothetical protein